jgi:hypothetical protein
LHRPARALDSIGDRHKKIACMGQEIGPQMSDSEQERMSIADITLKATGGQNQYPGVALLRIY